MYDKNKTDDTVNNLGNNQPWIKKLKPSLRSWPLVHHRFPRVMLTSVATVKLPNKLGPQVEVIDNTMYLLSPWSFMNLTLLPCIYQVYTGEKIGGKPSSPQQKHISLSGWPRLEIVAFSAAYQWWHR